MARGLTLPRAARGRHRQQPDPPPEPPAKRKRVRLHQTKPTPPPPGQPDPPSHHAIARKVDEHGHSVADYSNWATCTCEIGCDHLVD